MESYPGTNGSVSGVGVFPTEHHHHHLPLSVPVFTATACSSPYLDDSNSNNSLSEIFLDQYTEVDVSSEWLSSFVEECLSSAGNCLPPLPKLEQPKTATPSTTTTTRTTTAPKCAAPPANDNSTCPNPQISDKITITHNKIQTHQHFAVPGKPRSQRKRRRPTTTTTTTDRNPLLRWAECLYPETQPHQQLGFSDHPPLLEQTYWLADSELISLPRNDVKTLEDGGDYENSNKLNNKKKKMKKEDNRLEELDDEEFGNENSEGTGWEQQQQQLQQQQTRRCSHCQAQKTPQWRAGPLGPKTLCNACGVRYFKSGRLLPEYRPAKSPTFVSDKHSNSHKKVLQMRKAHLAPPSSTSPLG